MLKLYFSDVSTIISTVLIIGFGVFFGIVTGKRNNISHWGILVLVLFFVGLAMSMMSGMKDNISTPSALIPNKHWAMTLLSILGGLAFVVGIIMLIIRRQNFWQFGFYMLSAIIIAKTVMVEVYRIIMYIRT